jgi:hypothetical protein
MLRKNFITREWVQDPIWGTRVSKEIRTFQAGKIVEIEDVISIKDSLSITWNETEFREQTTLKTNEIPTTYSFDQIKKDYHQIKQADNQTKIELGDFTKWEIKIEIKTILIKYLYAQLKKARTFQDVTSNMTESGVENFIIDYINKNIIPRIRFKKVDLYVAYHDISIASRSDINAKAFNSIFDNRAISNNTSASLMIPNNYYNIGDLATQNNIAYKAIKPNRTASVGENLSQNKNWEIFSNKQNNILLNVQGLDDTAVITYKQIKSSKQFRFDYYFDLTWEKA